MILGRVGGGRSGEWEEWGVGGVGSGRSGKSGEWVPTPHSPGGETAVISFSQIFQQFRKCFRDLRKKMGACETTNLDLLAETFVLLL